MYQEHSILKRFNRNDPEAFSIIYKQLFASVYYYARKFVNAEEAEDITADAFTKIFKMEKNFQTIQSVKTYLQISVRNASFNYKEHLKVVKQNESGIAAITPIQTNGFTEEDKMRVEQISLIITEMEKLSQQRKKIFELFYLGGMKEKEIAAKLKIARPTVHNHKTIAMKVIRGKLIKLFVS